MVHSSGICTTLGTGPPEGGSGLLHAKNAWGEPNGPNTLDACTDGSAGVYERDESIEALTIVSTDGGVLKAGGKARIVAHVFTYKTGADNAADFYYLLVRPRAGTRLAVH